MFETYVVEKIKTHILCSEHSPPPPHPHPPENHAVYEIVWKNIYNPVEI